MYPKIPDYSFEKYWVHRDDYTVGYAGSGCHAIEVDGEQLFYDLYPLHKDDRDRYSSTGFRLLLR